MISSLLLIPSFEKATLAHKHFSFLFQDEESIREKWIHTTHHEWIKCQVLVHDFVSQSNVLNEGIEFDNGSEIGGFETRQCVVDVVSEVSKNDTQINPFYSTWVRFCFLRTPAPILWSRGKITMENL